MKHILKTVGLTKLNKARDFGQRFLLTGAALFGLLVLPTAVHAQSSACSANETVQNFTVPAGAWPAGTTGPQSFTVGTGANAVTMTFTITNAQPFTAGTPNQVQHGGLPDVVRAAHTTTTVNTSLSTQTITFSRPINKFVYVATDVDFLTGQWQDQVVARANGTLLPTSMVGGAGHTINLAAGTVLATTSNNCANTDPACNVTANFNYTGITSASEEFRTGPNHSGAQQFVGWTSFGFCAPNIEPNLSLVKDDGGASFVAGSTGTYTFTVSNAGTGATVGTTTVKDILPAGMSFTAPLTAGGANGALYTCVVSTTTNTNDTATCTTTTAIAAGGTNVLTLPVAVASTVATGTTLTNRAKVFGGNDPNKVAETTTGAISACASDSLAGAVANAGCGFETTPITAAASVVITKTDSKTVATSGGTNNYVITLTNQGPSVANGVIVTDVVGAGLTCPGANVVTCSGAVNGAVCPAASNITTLTGAGITVATLPVTGALQFAYTCNVN